MHLPGFPSPRREGAGPGAGPGAVLSVSSSITNRMRPGRSLLAESECMSGKVLRSGSETLELVSGEKQETCCQRVVTPTRPPEGALEEAGQSASAHAHTPRSLQAPSAPGSWVKPLRPQGSRLAQPRVLALVALPRSLQRCSPCRGAPSDCGEETCLTKTLMH